MTETLDPLRSIRAALTDELHIDPRKHPVRCEMVNGSVLLEGTVETISQKKKALLFAMTLEGVAGVVDRIRVAPSNHMSDDEIREHLEHAIAGEQTLSPLDIKIDVNNGVVDLEGEVGSLSHKRLAGVLAWWIPGSADVINSLEVAPPEDDNDDEITDALRIVLEKDKLVDESEIRIRTKDFIVTLDGLARSDAEKEAAEEDAWYVWGVNGVVNNIVVQAGTL